MKQQLEQNKQIREQARLQREKEIEEKRQQMLREMQENIDWYSKRGGFIGQGQNGFFANLFGNSQPTPAPQPNYNNVAPNQQG